MSESCKRTFRLDHVKVTSLVPENHPTYKGFLEAISLLGGSLPHHVREVRITDDIVPSKGVNREMFVLGRCWLHDQGGSRIELFGGSIREVVNPYLEDITAANVMLHEVGHSVRGYENQLGAWFDERKDKGWHEADAEQFVSDSRQEHHRRMRQGKPKTWREVLELRQQNARQEKS